MPIAPSKREISLKEKMMKARRAIQKKFQQLHWYQIALSESAERRFKPIIKPLTDLVDIAKKEQTDVKKETKNEIKTEQAQEPKSTKKKHIKIQPIDTTTTPSTSKTPTSSHIPRRLFGSQSFGKSGGHDDDDNGDADDEEGGFGTPKAKSPPPTGATASELLSARATAMTRTIQSGMSPRISNKHYSIQTDPSTREMRMGNSRGQLMKNEIRIGTRTYPHTPGVIDLLFLSRPSRYTADDLNVYKSILEHTNAHRQQYLPNSRIVRDETNPKYTGVIKKLFPPESEVSDPFGGARKKQGRGLKSLRTDYMIHSKNERKTFTYWDDPNELVERLRLLVASESAGHTSHHNEIMSIVEELREANIIA